MNIKLAAPYQSLTPFEWNNIPLFSIITGPNGSGKTQLLNLIYASLQKMKPPWAAEIDGISISHKQIYFNRGTWELSDSAADAGQVRDHYEEMYSRLSRKDFQDEDSVEFINCSKAIDASALTREDFFLNESIRLMQTRFSYDLNVLARLFYDYYLRQRFLINEGGMKEESFVEEYGGKPWEKLNAAFEKINFHLRCVGPEKLPYHARYNLEFYSIDRKDTKIRMPNLSSGEKVIVSVLTWIFWKERKLPFPQLVLLDEPDAHLHPHFVKTFVDALEQVLVKENGIRVIMTTHSPVTAAFAPAGSLFQLDRPSQMKGPQSNQEIVRALSGGMVTVFRGSKYVLVEAEDDVEFYNCSLGLLQEFKKLPKGLSLIFIAASSAKENETGGKKKVVYWASKLSTSGLEGILSGLIDRDGETEGKNVDKGVVRLSRYSIENFLIDPTILLQYLKLIPKYLHNNTEFTEVYGTLVKGFRSDVRAEELAVSNYSEFILALAKKVQLDVSVTKTITYYLIDGREMNLNIPVGFLESKGKDLQQKLRDHMPSVFGNIGNRRLLEVFSTSRIVPADLLIPFDELAKP